MHTISVSVLRQLELLGHFRECSVLPTGIVCILQAEYPGGTHHLFDKSLLCQPAPGGLLPTY